MESSSDGMTYVKQLAGGIHRDAGFGGSRRIYQPLYASNDQETYTEERMAGQKQTKDEGT
jgi:hypothetical protein